MLIQCLIPDEILLGEDGVHGDWDLFFKSFESGEQARHYDESIAFYESRDDNWVKHQSGMGVVLPGCV